jgi:hypothetical protein
MDLRRRLGMLARVGLSVVGAGVFYVLWLAAFLKAQEMGNPALIVAGWLSAPVVTAAGFAAGTAIIEPLAGSRWAGFFHILAWPLVACVVGAATVYPFGAMLIVFGMFAAGTAAMVLRELLRASRKDGRL